MARFFCLYIILGECLAFLASGSDPTISIRYIECVLLESGFILCAHDISRLVGIFPCMRITELNQNVESIGYTCHVGKFGACAYVKCAPDGRYHIKIVPVVRLG